MNHVHTGPLAGNYPDITYIRTHEGWLYLAAVTDLFSRKIVDWAMGSTMHTDLVLQALMMAVWRRKPQPVCSCTPIKERSSRDRDVLQPPQAA